MKNFATVLRLLAALFEIFPKLIWKCMPKIIEGCRFWTAVGRGPGQVAK